MKHETAPLMHTLRDPARRVANGTANGKEELVTKTPRRHPQPPPRGGGNGKHDENKGENNDPHYLQAGESTGITG